MLPGKVQEDSECTVAIVIWFNHNSNCSDLPYDHTIMFRDSTQSLSNPMQLPPPENAPAIVIRSM